MEGLALENRGVFQLQRAVIQFLIQPDVKYRDPVLLNCHRIACIRQRIQFCISKIHRHATVLWIKIKKSDYTFTEGSWTISNATLMTMGSFKEGSSYPSGNRSAVVRNGYLYVPSYDKTGIYKINISNSTDVTLIQLGFTSTM